MNTSSKKFRNIFLGSILVVASLLTAITLQIQQKRTQENFKSDLGEIAKKSEKSASEQKTPKNDTHQNSWQEYMNPASNIRSMDRQSTANPHYDLKTESPTPELEIADTFEIKSFKDIPDKGEYIIFLYKPNVESSKDYQPVINEFASSDTNYKFKYRVLDIEKANITDNQFYSFISKNSNIQISSPPLVSDVYAIGVKDKNVYTYVTKTDTNNNSFNVKNLRNIIDSLVKLNVKGD